jgi:selenocysteine lyase/cysteine desulfurase
MPVDVQAIGCDFLSATGRKYLRGPRGTGLLFVRESWLDRLEPVFLDLHAATWTAPGEYVVRPDARRFENWETNVAGKLGLRAAIDYALAWGLDRTYARIVRLAERLRQQLAQTPGVAVCDLGQQRCGLVSFTVHTAESREVQRRLSAANINVSVSPRHYTLLDMSARQLESIVRASVHYYNTDAEVDRFCEELATVAGSLPH